MSEYKLLFGVKLAKILEEKSLSQTKFSRKIKRTQSFVSKVVRGVNGPADNLEDWASALELKGTERSEFLECGYLALSPSYIQQLVKDLKSKTVTGNEDTD